MPLSAFINLTSGETAVQETDPALLACWLGGRGLAAAILYQNVGPNIAPLDPENYLVFAAGPFAGTPWPTSARLHVTFKSPATEAYGYANSGGHFVAELRHAGYDAVIITGKATEPVILKIHDDKISVEPAAGLWGKTTGEVHTALLGEKPKASAGRVACIGPAGEKLVTIAAIINDYSRAAARGGPGAVMGSKNLKAIHVKATQRLQLSPDFRNAAKTTAKKLSADPHLEGLRKYGTLVLMDSKNAGGDQPAKNHQLVQVPFINNINATAFDNYVLDHKGCYACPIKCGRKSEVGSGEFAVEIGGPEYETTNALGPMCWLGKPDAIIYANHLCNEYGLDTISAGVVIAFAMELHEKGLLNDPDLSLEWGDADTVLGLLKKIAYRDGLGDLLANGTRRAAEAIGHGAEQYAMQVKGVELPRQEPRFAKGFGLGHATSNRGADHLYAMPAIDLAGNWDAARHIFDDEIVSELMNPGNEKYKPDMVVYGEHYCAITDALGICKFSTVEEYSLFPEDLAPGVTALWKKPLTGQELLTIGERIVNLERLYNVREGLSRADDQLPRRFTEERAPLYEFTPNPDTGEMQQSDKPFRYSIIEDFDAMLNRYYNLRGWSLNGVPTPETLQRLGLEKYLEG